MNFCEYAKRLVHYWSGLVWIKPAWNLLGRIQITLFRRDSPRANQVSSNRGSIPKLSNRLYPHLISIPISVVKSTVYRIV